MKQFFVFIHSQFSPASHKCEAIIKSLSPDIKFNYLCVDNKENRAIIQSDKSLDIHVVPCLLIVNTVDGRVTKYEGKKCFDYLIQYKKQQTPLAEPMPMSTYQPPPQPVAQPQPQPLPPQSRPQPLPTVQQQKVVQQQQAPPQQRQVQKPIIFDEEDSFSNPPDVNQTSSLLLSENDDDDEAPPPLPVPKKSKQQQQQVQQPPPPAKGGKPSLLAQATAMQKSRLMEDEFSTKKNNIN
jgi:hypothetical protein